MRYVNNGDSTLSLGKNNQKVIEEQAIWRGTNSYVKISLINLKVSAICAA